MKKILTDSHWRMLLPVAALVLAFVPRVWGIGDKTVWMDEDRQAGYANAKPLDFGILNNASKQQQPPLDYYLETIGIQNFGLSGVGIRLNAAIFGALAALIFSLLLLKYVKNRLIVVVGTLLFAFHPWLVRYSQEARPISLGVLCSVLFVAALLSFLDKGDSRRSASQRLVALIAAQIAFLLSVGFAPIVFLASSSLSLIPFLFFGGQKRKVLLVWGSTLCAMLLTYPILSKSLANSGSLMDASDSIIGILDNMTGRLDSVQWGFFLSAYSVLFGQWIPLFVLTAILCLAGILRGEMKREYRLAMVYLGLLAVCYPFVFTVLYGTLINRHGGIPARYYLTLAPVVILLLCVAGRIAYAVAMRLGESRSYARYGLSVLFVVAFVWGSIGNLQKMDELMSEKKREWNELYKLFKDKEMGNGFAYTVNFVMPGRWSAGFWSKRFYYPKAKRLVKLKRERHLKKDYRKPKLWSKRRNVYLVTVSGDNQIDPGVLDGIRGVEFFRFHRLSAIRISAPGDKKDEVFEVISRLRGAIKVSPRSYMLSKLLYEMAAVRKDRDTLERSCEELKGLKGKGKLKKIARKCSKALAALENALGNDSDTLSKVPSKP